MLVGDVLYSVRESLSDTSKTRWSDARLLALLNDGLSILMMSTILFIDRKYVPVFADLEEYDISTYAAKILRVEYKGLPLDLVTHEFLDNFDKRWKSTISSTFTHAITDKYRSGKFRLYPTVNTLDGTLVEQNDTLGIITDITYTDYQLEMLDSLGEVGTPEDSYVYVHFCKNMGKIVDLLEDLDIDDFIRVALQHYIVARALRDNQDTQNRALANEEMQFFDKLVETYSIARSQLYNGSSNEVTYRGGVF